MRQNQNQNQNQNKNRSRGRARKPGNQSNRTFDSNGPDVKIRGSASHIYEKYQSLSRDANAAGNRVGAENYMQHAEHYFRLMAVAQAAQQSREQQNQPRPKQNGAAESGSDNGGAGPNTRSDAAPVDEKAKPGQAKAKPRTEERQGAVADTPSLPAAYLPDGSDVAASAEAAEEQKPARKRRPRQPRVKAKVEPKVETEAPAESAVSDDATA